jgi:hypothetical protein
VAAAIVGDPACGFDVYRGELSVTSLGAEGDVWVWLRKNGRLVRSGHRLDAGWTMVFPLKRKHSNDDFQVAVTAPNRAHGDEQVSWCEPA